MNITPGWLRRQLAVCLVLLLTAPCGMAATTPSSAPSPPAKSAASGQAKSGHTAVTGGERAAVSYPDAPTPSFTYSGSQSQEATASTSQQTRKSQPVGTAAAPNLKSEGVSASRPAGAAIAPAKQRRVRSFAIRIALLVGAGVAIGTVVAASMGSPSRAN